MGIFLVTIKKNTASVQIYMFYKVKKALGLCKFIDKEHEIMNFNKILELLKILTLQCL